MESIEFKKCITDPSSDIVLFCKWVKMYLYVIVINTNTNNLNIGIYSKISFFYEFTQSI